MPVTDALPLVLYASCLAWTFFVVFRWLAAPFAMRLAFAMTMVLTQAFVAFFFPGVFSILTPQTVLAFAFFLSFIIHYVARSLPSPQIFAPKEMAIDPWLTAVVAIYFCILYAFRAESALDGENLRNGEFYILHGQSIYKFIETGSLWTPYTEADFLWLTHEIIAGSISIFVRSFAPFLYVDFYYMVLFSAACSMWIVYAAQWSRRPLLFRLFSLIAFIFFVEIYVFGLMVIAKNEFAGGVLAFAGAAFVLYAYESIKKNDARSAIGLFWLAGPSLALAASIKPYSFVLSAVVGLNYLGFAVIFFIKNKNVRPLLQSLAVGLLALLPVCFWLLRNYTVAEQLFDPGWIDYTEARRAWRILLPLDHRYFGLFSQRGIYPYTLLVWMFFFLAYAGSILLLLFQKSGPPPFIPMVAAWATIILITDFFLLPGNMIGPSGEPNSYFFKMDTRYFVSFMTLATGLAVFCLLYRALGTQTPKPALDHWPHASHWSWIFSFAFLFSVVITVPHIQQWETQTRRGMLGLHFAVARPIDLLGKPSKIAAHIARPSSLLAGRFWIHRISPMRFDAGLSQEENLRKYICAYDALVISEDRVVENVNFDFAAALDFLSKHPSLTKLAQIEAKVPWAPFNYGRQIAYFKVTGPCL